MSQNKHILIITGAGASKELGISCGKDFLYEMLGRLCTSLNIDEKGEFKKGEGKYQDMINQYSLLKMLLPIKRR